MQNLHASTTLLPGQHRVVCFLLQWKSTRKGAGLDTPTMNIHEPDDSIPEHITSTMLCTECIQCTGYFVIDSLHVVNNFGKRRLVGILEFSLDPHLTLITWGSSLDSIVSIIPLMGFTLSHSYWGWAWWISPTTIITMGGCRMYGVHLAICHSWVHHTCTGDKPVNGYQTLPPELPEELC